MRLGHPNDLPLTLRRLRVIHAETAAMAMSAQMDVGHRKT